MFPSSGRMPGLLLTAIVLLLAGTAAAQSGPLVLGQPGYLIISGARDSTGTYVWQDGPGPGRRSLVWPEGTLSLPDTVFTEPYGRQDLGLPCRAEMSGVGKSGSLVFSDGDYTVSEPIVVSDGILELHLAAGRLEVRGSQIRYRRPDVAEPKTRANLILLAGLALLIIVLMRRARLHLRKS